MKKILLLIIISIFFYALWRVNSPYPSVLNWDIWEHQTVINAIRSGSFSVLPSQLSDTFQFDGYTTAFHVVIAGIQNIFNIQNIPGFWWIAEGVFFILTTLATYAFIYAVTKNKLAAIAGGILSAGLFESAVAFTTLFLLPQTVAALLWVIGMTLVVKQKTKRNRLLVAGLATLVSLPFHAIVGALGAVFLFALALDLNIHWLLVLAASYVIPTFLAAHFRLSGLNGGEAQYFNQTIFEKLNLLRQWYGLLPIPFLVIGAWKGNRTLTVLLAASIGLMASPFPYVLKFMVIIHYLMIAVMAIGIGVCLDSMKSKTAQITSIIALTIAVVIIFFTNTIVWKSTLNFRGAASEVSADEFAVANTLKTMYGNELTFLISDPATQAILEPLTGIDSEGGAYMTDSTRQALLQALNGGDIQALRKIHSGTTLLAISARTMKWLAAKPADQMSIAFNIWRPDSLSMEDDITIQWWQQEFSLTEVYRNASVVVFKI